MSSPEGVGTLPRLAITMGDAAGVGPELCLRALLEAREYLPVVVGDATLLRRVARQLDWPCTACVLTREEWIAAAHAPPATCIVDLQNLAAGSVQPGVLTADNGRTAYEYIQAAIDFALSHQVDAVTTAPISKEALHRAGINMPGHTEMFAARCQSARWCMMQYSPTITCSFVTVHVGYAEVPALLSVQRVQDVIELTAEAMRRIRGKAPRIVVCGLNPHAGEHGLFGEREEERYIVPAIEAARRQGILVEGPVPADTAFLAGKRAAVDAFVCMYHDQGHIPVKALAFDSAVNTTLGLSIVRTSVDHGTAYDIAWQGRADPGSLRCALRLASQLAGARAP